MEKVKCKYCGKVGRSGTKCHACSRTVQEIVIPKEDIIVTKVKNKKKKVTKVEDVKVKEECNKEDCIDCDCTEEENTEDL